MYLALSMTTALSTASKPFGSWLMSKSGSENPERMLLQL